MKCEKVQECVDAYINHTLPDWEQREFIEHVKQCTECYNELETYFIVDQAIRYLDEEKEESYNIKQLLDEDLNKRLVKLRHKNLAIQALIIIAILLGVTAVAGLGWFAI